MAIELAAAYISIYSVTDKIAPNVTKALKESEKAADKSGKTMGDSIAKNLTGALSNFEKDSKTAGSKAADNIGSGVKAALGHIATDSKLAGKAIGDNLGGGITKSLKDAEASSKRSGSKIGDNLRNGARTGLSRVGDAFSGWEKEAARSGSRIGSQMGTGLRKGVSAAAPVVAGIIGGIAVGAGGLGLFGIKTAAGFEQTQIAFETLLKSTNRAKKEMDWLKAKAAATPFELKDLSDADKTLLNFGFTSDQVRQDFLVNMGNIAAAVGLPGNRLADLAKVFGQVKAAGVAQLDDVNQLIDAGVPVWDALTKSTGKSVKQLRDDISKGKLTSDVFLKSLEGYSKTNFGTAMEKQGQSIAGMWSSISDSFSLGAAKLIEPFVPFIKDIMPKVSGWMGIVGNKIAGVIPKAIDLGKSFKDNVLPGIVSVANTVKNNLLPPLLSVGGFIVTHLPLILGLAGGIAALAVGMKAWGIATQAVATAQGLYNGIIKVWTVLTTAQTAAQVGLDAAMSANVIGIIVLALIALVAGIIYAYQHFDGFRNLVLTVWSAIQTAISFAWNSVILPVLTAIGWFITNVLAPVFTWLFANIISPYFTLIGAIISGVWTRIIYPLFQFWAWVMINVVGAPFVFLYEKIIKPVFGAIGTFIGFVWRTGIKPYLEGIGNFITKTVVPAFQKGVDALKSIWSGIQSAFVIPVNFVIDKVYNNGIRKLINSLPGVTDVPAMNLIGASASGPSGGGTPNQKNRGRDLGFAKGGPVTGGTRGKDSVRAWLMPGEHVLTADEVQAAGGQGAIFALRKSLANGGLGKSFDPDPRFASGGTLSADQIKKAKDFANSNVGDPYVWGGVGPNGFDCSGLMSAITNVIRGANPYSRVGATGNFPWKGFEAGPGQFTIGSTDNYGGSGVGHMAGTLDGMNVESRGGRGVLTGSAARGYSDPGFNEVYHLGAAGSDGGFLASVTDVLKSLKGWVTELGGMGGFAGLIKQMVQGVGGQLKNFINDKVPGPGPLNGGIFDNGGILEPGAVAFNASNKPEAVFNQSQFKQIADGKGSPVTRAEFTITNWKTGEGYFREIAGQEIDDAADYAASGNRRNR